VTRLIRTELLKLRTMRLTYGLLAVAAALSALFALLENNRAGRSQSGVPSLSTAAGLATAVVSSSANTRQVLEITGLEKFIQQRVDGVTLREEHIAGKPAPDSFLRAAQLLGVTPAEAAVFEDALSGVAAGHAGHFGLVVGVDRVGQADELRSHGADVVVTDLADLI